MNKRTSRVRFTTVKEDSMNEQGKAGGGWTHAADQIKVATGGRGAGPGKPRFKLRTLMVAPLVLGAAVAFATRSAGTVVHDTDGEAITLQAGHPSLAKWRLPSEPPSPDNNAPTADRVALGKMLFFDPRLSRDGNMSCATCHNPMFGWSDGLPVARGFRSEALARATPTVVNTGYNPIQMWDGRKATLEDQAMGPMEAAQEMNMNLPALFKWLNQNGAYREAFQKAYPGQAIDSGTLSKAIAAYERTVVSRDSPFDRWVAGDTTALTPQQVRGFGVFIDPNKGNCSVCHSGANFTDNGFHNLGLASWGENNPDMGRFTQKPIARMKGAFKTPTVREAARTAPYFHDGSAATLADVVEHYAKGGVVKDNLSPNMKALDLTTEEKAALVEFMQALSSPHTAVELPRLPN
ncbi:MAG: cytochrome-c peroxidase [Betaproteobacteria bacterium]|jgi:cytochrome c peroxidase